MKPIVRNFVVALSLTAYFPVAFALPAEIKDKNPAQCFSFFSKLHPFKSELNKRLVAAGLIPFSLGLLNQDSLQAPGKSIALEALAIKQTLVFSPNLVGQRALLF